MESAVGNSQPDDDHWMSLALGAAQAAAAEGEVPVGAVLVHRPSPGAAATLLACTHNCPIGLNDPTAHAELLALRAAASKLGNYRLEDCELYVTLEPCAMCAQAMLHARVRRVVYGATEPKTGAAGSVLNLFAVPKLNHHTVVQSGVQADACGALLRDFFLARRLAHKRDAAPVRDDALRTPDVRFQTVWDHYPDWRSCSHSTQEPPVLDRLRLHWLDLGQQGPKPPWLALHSPEAWWPQLAPWARDRVSTGERVLLPDLIGFGQSDKPKKPQWHSLDAHARILWGWLTAQGQEQVRLAVAPGQAQLAAELQRSAPQRVVACHRLSHDVLATLPQDWANLPYPDRGHRAAHRAWVQHGWGQENMTGQ